MNHVTYSEKELIDQLLSDQVDMFEQATIMYKLCGEFKYTQNALSKVLGISQSSVGNKVRLLQYSFGERTMIKEYGLSERHARALLRIEQPKRAKLIETVGKLHLTVEETETIVEKYKNSEALDTFEHRNVHRSSSLPIDSFLQQTLQGAERLRSLGNKVSCLTEADNGRWRITVIITE